MYFFEEAPADVTSELDVAMIGLWGVIVGALISLIGTVVVPWIRDSLDRRRVKRELLQSERRDAILDAMSALMDMHHRPAGDPARAEAQVRFASRFNYLTVRFTKNEQPILDVLNLMLVMVQDAQRRTGIERMVAECMTVLSYWVRGEVDTRDVVSEVEERAGIEFSADRKTATPKATAPAPSA